MPTATSCTRPATTRRRAVIARAISHLPHQLGWHGKTQITFGTTGESDPRWSLDGKQITFVAYSQNLDVMRLCRMDADGHNQRTLRAFGERETLPAPATPGYRLENIEGASRKVPERHILINVKTGQQRVLPVPTHEDPSDEILPMPGAKLVYAVNNHTSTVSIDSLFYHLNAMTGAMHYLTEGQFWPGRRTARASARHRGGTRRPTKSDSSPSPPIPTNRPKSASETCPAWFGPPRCLSGLPAAARCGRLRRAFRM